MLDDDGQTGRRRPEGYIDLDGAGDAVYLSGALADMAALDVASF